MRAFEADDWKRRVLIAEKDGKALCWQDKNNKLNAYTWDEWREIQPQKELTQEEKINIIWEKYGK